MRDNQTPSQFTAPASSISSLATEIREVFRCSHCHLIQFRTRDAMCRRCHKPLGEAEQLCISPDPAPPAAAAIASQLGIRVRAFRRMRGLSQRKLAERMKVPRTYVSKIESCRVIPTLTSLCRMARALEIETHYLLLDQKCEFRAIARDPFIEEMAQLVEYLDREQQAAILEAARVAAIRNRGPAP